MKIDLQTQKTWTSLIDDLMKTIESWAEEQGWFVEHKPKTISEDNIGTYEVLEVYIKTPQGRIIVEPVGRNIIGAEGRVEITTFPSLNRILLVRSEDRWKVKTDSRIDWPEPWNKETFLNIVHALTREE